MFPVCVISNEPVIPSIISTLPVPFPESCKLEFDVFVETVLSFTVTPSSAADPVNVKVEPSNVKFDSAVIALEPVPVSTAFEVKDVAPVPPLATDNALAKPPVNVNAPVILTPSAKVIVLESSALKVVPCILNALAKTPPVPDADNFKSEFDTVV